MKTISILIPNYNSWQAVQLAVESIRHYNAGHPYRIIVYNDRPVNGVDEPYLQQARERGLVDELYSGQAALTHGGVLNVLINEKCHSDYAAVLDSDTYIKGDGWLRDLINAAETDPKIAVVADLTPGGLQGSGDGYKAPVLSLWFGLINMTAYRGGLQSDFMLSIEDRSEFPYCDMFADCYPPETSGLFQHLWQQRRADGKRKYFPNYEGLETFPRNRVVNDPGSQLYIALLKNAAKGYRVEPLPLSVRGKWHHVGHISMLGPVQPAVDSEWNTAHRASGFALIRAELEKIRRGK